MHAAHYFVMVIINAMRFEHLTMHINSVIHKKLRPNNNVNKDDWVMVHVRDISSDWFEHMCDVILKFPSRTKLLHPGQDIRRTCGQTKANIYPPSHREWRHKLGTQICEYSLLMALVQDILSFLPSNFKLWSGLTKLHHRQTFK